MTFEFIKEVDNTIVPTDEIDKMVCNEFGLAYNNLNKFGEIDYGHFTLDYLSYGQDYISWHGLISTILSFGNPLAELKAYNFYEEKVAHIIGI